MTTSPKAITMFQAESNRISPALANSRFFPRLILAFAVAFGLIDAVASRNSMGPDGISYLDIADALRQGHWSALFNPLWSPMYPFLLSIGFRIFHPSPYWEFTVVHFVNLFIYLGALACFSFFMQAFVAYTGDMQNEIGVALPISPETWAALGYALFVWSSARLTSVEAVTPDMCLSAFIYLAAAILLRIKTLGGSWLNYSLLGIVLGFGFWAKAPMFPLASVFLLVSVFAANDWRQGIKRAFVAGIIFAAVASPLVYGLSHSKGRLTFGDSARLNYSFFINRVPKYYWDSSASKTQSAPEYPAQKLFDTPAVYRFTIPLQGTYPYWYDPTYWYGNVKPKLNLRGFIRETMVNLEFDARMFVRLQPAIPLVFLLLVALSSTRLLILRDLTRQWVLLAVPVAGVAMFSLVHTERRYVAPFIGLILLGLFTAVSIRNSARAQGTVSWLMVALALFLMLHMSAARAGELRALREAAAGGARADDTSWKVSSILRQEGLQPGDQIAWIRPNVVTSTDNYWWARLAKLQIIAEIPNDGNEFWTANEITRSAALQSLSQTGVKAAVVSNVPPQANLQSFVPVGSTGYYVHFYQHD
jgi:4-amino-4-deoxy-L-arabinose transferase-like glycosyltransferase